MELILNQNEINTKQTLLELSGTATEINVAVAFFSEDTLIKEWLSRQIKVNLIVSLRPPTNYYTIREFYTNNNVNLKFLKSDFHSKFWIFKRNDKIKAALVGSSNFTSGGLENNIESNISINEPWILNKMSEHFEDLWSKSRSLQPDELENYKNVYDKYKAMKEEIDTLLGHGHSNGNGPQDVSDNAQLYYQFWKIVDEVKSYVQDISEKEYPGIPLYLTIDHFWHWIKKVWGVENETPIHPSDKRSTIRRLFLEYCKWDKNTGSHTIQMNETSKWFSHILSPSNINNLTKEDAIQVYLRTHAGNDSIKYGSQNKFIEENSLANIIKSLKYLLYSEEDVVVRIHNIQHRDSPYKLIQMGFSVTQELLGWVHPEKYPLRNNKADEAIRMIGYPFP